AGISTESGIPDFREARESGRRIPNPKVRRLSWAEPSRASGLECLAQRGTSCAGRARTPRQVARARDAEYRWSPRAGGNLAREDRRGQWDAARGDVHALHIA